MRRFSIVLCLILMLAPIAAAQPQAPATPSTSYPGVAEVVPRLTDLVEEKVRAETRIASLQDLSVPSEQLATARGRQQELSDRIADMGDIRTWNQERLQEIRGVLGEQQVTLKRLLDALSARLLSLDQLRREWRQRQDFWQGWQEEFGPSPVGIPREAFTRVRNLTEEVLEEITASFPPVLQLQEEVTRLHERNLSLLNEIDVTLASLRQKIFSRTAIPFTKREFLGQFDGGLWRSTVQGIVAVEPLRGDYLRENAWLLAIQLLLASGLGAFIRRQRRRPEITREWQFILDHPWATGIFVAISSLGFLYPVPPALWRLLLWSLAAVSAAILMSGLLRNPRKVFMVNLLAALFVLSLGLQIISLPQPLFRLYLALLSALLIPLLLAFSVRNRREHEGRTDGFTLSLQGGALVLLASLAAQIGGFSALASRLIAASVEIISLGLFLAMVIRLGRGGIEFLLSREFFRRRPFFRLFGGDLTVRLQWLFQCLAFGAALLYLPVAWGIIDSLAEVWDRLLGIGFRWGETWISVQMLALILLVLYATIVFSWMARALLEAEIFPHRELDRGVRDAIKKLLHYFLIVIGFLLAVSLAGIDLQNFTVLAGAFGIGIGFGLQNIVNNFVSGLILLFERPVKVGDVIVLDEVWGTVRKIGLRSTIVETLDDAEIIVPNSELISEKVTNWTLSTRVARIIINVGVAYGSDVEKVIRILQETAREHPDVLQEPPPSTLFSEFGDSSLNFQLRVWISEVRKRLRVKSELNQYIERRFRQAGVEIPFPQRDLHLRSVDREVLGKLRSAEGEEPVTAGKKPVPAPAEE